MSLKGIKLLLILILLFGCKEKEANKELIDIQTSEYHIYCEESDLKKVFENYRENNYIPITIKNKKNQRNALMRIRGDSSRDYEKKSLKVKISDSLSINTKMILNFNAEYSDLSFLRSFLASKIFKKMNYPCFSTSFSKIYINNKYHGLFLEIENMDKQFLKNNGLNPSGDLFKATKDGACLYSLKELESKWEKKTNKKSSWVSLEELIYDLSNIKDADFYDYIKEHFNYPMLIDFLAINAFIANGSTYYHNYYLYQDQENNGKWILLPWDLDKTISYYDWKPYKYHETSSDWESDNILIEKCFLNEQIFNDFKDRIKFLQTVINEDFYNPIFEGAIKNLKHEIINDSTNQIPSEKEWIKTINKERSFLYKRSENIIKYIEKTPRSFKVDKTPQELSIPFKVSWEKSQSNLEYELWISNDFLFPEDNTYKFYTNDVFYWIEKDIPNGKYYWKVIAKNNANEIEGFNTKNIFSLKTGTVLPKIINQDLILTKENSPYRVNEDIKIEELVTIYIEPGTTILIAENAEVTCYGDFNAIGTENEPISILPIEPKSYFKSIYFLNCEANINYVNIKDGLINSKYSNLSIKNTNININNRPMQIGEKRPSIIWGWHGNINLNNLVLNGNGKGEGINISYSNAKIENSQFYNTPDAIELINVDQGFIINNIVMNSPDDAIDLNDCSNVKIKSNYLINNYDKGISIGTDWANEFISKNPQFNGKSSNIEVYNNYILGNNIGLAVKDSSIVNSKNNIISYNTIGVKLYKKHENYQLGGTLHSQLDQIYNNSNNISKDKFSHIKIIDEIDSVKIIQKKDSFIIPNLIKYKIEKEKIILYNKSSISFSLEGLNLLDDTKNIFNFNSNHFIKPNEVIIIGNKEINELGNYFYNTQINYENLNKLFLQDLDENKILLLKDD